MLGGEQNGFSPRERLTLPSDSFAEAQNTDIMVLLFSNHREHPPWRQDFISSLPVIHKDPEVWEPRLVA